MKAKIKDWKAKCVEFHSNHHAQLLQLQQYKMDMTVEQLELFNEHKFLGLWKYNLLEELINVLKKVVRIEVEQLEQIERLEQINELNSTTLPNWLIRPVPWNNSVLRYVRNSKKNPSSPRAFKIS